MEVWMISMMVQIAVLVKYWQNQGTNRINKPQHHSFLSNMILFFYHMVKTLYASRNKS